MPLERGFSTAGLTKNRLIARLHPDNVDALFSELQYGNILIISIKFFGLKFPFLVKNNTTTSFFFHS